YGKLVFACHGFGNNERNVLIY
uniref:Uncharacterized protein n=1 Tax=Amphimedon queenslandica TaxID=400682 RepID=A0A1X7TLI3_AMPQE